MQSRRHASTWPVIGGGVGREADNASDLFGTSEACHGDGGARARAWPESAAVMSVSIPRDVDRDAAEIALAGGGAEVENATWSV